MIITNGTKAKVFAAYLGQLAITTKESYKNPEPGILQQIDLKDDDHQIIIQPEIGGYYLCSVSECKLLLKSLRKLTDDDAKHIAKMMGSADLNIIIRDKDGNFLFICEEISSRKEKGIPSPKHYTDSISLLEGGILHWDDNSADHGVPASVSTEVSLQCYQYLQAQGYDLPNYLLAGKTLQEAGLAIYE